MAFKILSQIQLERSASSTTTTTMPFGKHKGQSLYDIPIDYLEWAVKTLTDKPYLLQSIEAVLKTRTARQKETSSCSKIPIPEPQTKQVNPSYIANNNTVFAAINNDTENVVHDEDVKRVWDRTLPHSMKTLEQLCDEFESDDYLQGS